ncbi:hypothetical protein PMAYCL1PPCAC_15666 [Pristionchus mayeri]|uniref:Uncharacterized protein n=1 Tax=Pristionchus mayeri TaxID=1317129 RepID=A0AAN5CJA5_9BILA|nr:hypothetical protein PMAYCL1PPCAC_15666 [Pristionchus mayeri]
MARCIGVCREKRSVHRNPASIGAIGRALVVDGGTISGEAACLPSSFSAESLPEESLHRSANRPNSQSVDEGIGSQLQNHLAIDSGPEEDACVQSDVVHVDEHAVLSANENEVEHADAPGEGEGGHDEQRRPHQFQARVHVILPRSALRTSGDFGRLVELRLCFE